MRRKTASVAFAGVVLALGCGSNEDSGGGGNGPAGCVPGKQQSCPCLDGTVGVQVCDSTGTAFGQCDGCGTGQGGFGGAAGSAGSSGAAGSGAVSGSSGVGGSGAEGGSAGVGGSGAVGGSAGVGGSGAVGGTAGSAGAGAVGGTAGTGATGGTAGSAGVGAAGGVGGSGGTGIDPPPPPPPPPDGEYASAIRITKVSLYQGVEIPLMDAGAEVASSTRTAPVVVGRPALVRVFVEPQSGWVARDVQARLDLASASDPNVQPIGSATQTIDAASSDADLASTFTFEVPGTSITSDVTFSASIREVTAGGGGGVAVDGGVLWPYTGTQALAGKAIGGPLSVVIVPFRYMADGSGRMPDTSQEQMDRYFNVMFANYPITDLDLQLHTTVDYSGYVDGNSGWESWLDTLCDIRQNDNVDSKTYYYGIMAMASSANAYGGGIYGLGNVPSASDDWGRCSVGVGFDGGDTNGWTMIHEVGHTLGRPHAPCGVSGEQAYPYSGASIGSWGYSSTSKTMKDPNDFTDFMSYCSPKWISDYTYNKVFNRLSYINANEYYVPTPPKLYWKVLVGLDGVARWGQPIVLRRPPSGDHRTVTLLDAAGQPIGTATGSWTPFGDDPGGALFVPEPSGNVAAIQPQGLPPLAL